MGGGKFGVGGLDGDGLGTDEWVLKAGVGYRGGDGERDSTITYTHKVFFFFLVATFVNADSATLKGAAYLCVYACVHVYEYMCMLHMCIYAGNVPTACGDTI
jgi:hypothetical protein